MTMNMRTFTKQQIIRQDFVDNRIFELINSLLPASKQIKWDIEIIGDIRELIYKKLDRKLRGINEKRFYPFIEI